MTQLVLASASPRRRMLLESAGVEFEVQPADIDETPQPGEVPTDYVLRVARGKARAVATPGRVVLAADTTVDLGGVILGKPSDERDARRMLRSLSGRAHRVHSGVVVIEDGRERDCVVSTEVLFTELSDGAIERYVATGEPLDKAGAYAIQGGAAAFVGSVNGSVSNVVGLPLAETLRLLDRPPPIS